MLRLKAFIQQNHDITLPRLDTALAIRNLSLEESYCYFKGYFPDAQMINGNGALPKRINAIFRAIGRADLAEDN